jgi:hypothetical protein
MSYFTAFPLVRYDSSLQVNLTRRVGVSQTMKNDPAYYYEHNIGDGDTPENLADRFYDDVNLAWVILQFNDIVNIFEEWPKPQWEFDSYVNATYEDPYAIHHYVDYDGKEIDFSTAKPWERIPITNYEHETELNDAKRKIKLVLPELVNTIVNRHKEIIQEGV